MSIEALPGPPPFVKLKEDRVDDNMGNPNNWDGWAVEPTGDTEADYKTGADYADIALRKVIQTDSVGAMTLPLTAMFIKIAKGEIQPGPMEKGFVDCLARRAADRRQQLDSN